MGSPRIAAALSWYWTWSEGEMSAPSNFTAMANAISLGRNPSSYPSTEMDEGRLKAAECARHISRTLAHVAALDQHVLFVAFGPHALKLPVLGEAAPVAVLTRTAGAAYRASQSSRSFGDWLVRLSWRVAKRLGDHVLEDSATLHAISDEAKAALEKALAAYRDAEKHRRERSIPIRPEPSQTAFAAGVEAHDRQEAGDTNI